MRRTLLLCGLLGMLWPAFASAQFSADYQTNIISGVVSNWWPEYYVGSNTVFDLLRIENGGVLSNDVGFIGYETSASNNAVIVNGSGARWMLAILAVGLGGSGSQLTITNGGQVMNSWDSNVGSSPFDSRRSSNNVITVTGTGSVWSNGHNLILSSRGGNNRLLINHGSAVYALDVELGIGGGDNEVIVDGTGSVLSCILEIDIGSGSSGNAVVVSDGGQLIGSRGTVGGNHGSSGSNNRVLVTGPGSIWSNTYNLSIGSNTDSGVAATSGGNSMVISNGGQVIDSSASVGGETKTNNVLVTGVGSVWNNTSNLWIGPEFGNRLTISDGGVVLSRSGIIGSIKGCSVLVTGSGSVWNCQHDLAVSGKLNSLVISNAGLVIGSIADIGSGFESNSLVVTSGGTMISSNLVVGRSTTSCNNSVTVADASLFVTNASHNAILEVRSGMFTLSDGTVIADTIVVTNACGRFIHSGGNLVIGSLVLDPAMDADGDGLPNGWEQDHGLDPLTPDAEVDTDGDGMSNIQEYLAGTDPTNSAAALRITSIVCTNNDVNIGWTTAGGRTNVVQVSTDLSGSYSNVSPNIVITGSNETTTNYTHVGAAANFPSRFYRVRLVP